MTSSCITVGKQRIPVYSLNTVVVGSGAAGLSAADRLFQYGQTDIALVTEHINAGTSRNTGSDKQTYYKITLSGGEPDSVGEMARTLFDGQCMDGDNALCEAALSAQGFLRLVEAGVPFPRNRYGEFIGYKTDHDPRRRATSVGPYTSRRMTECLEAQVKSKGIQIYDRLQVVRVLSDGSKVKGILCLRLEPTQPEERFVAFQCKNVVWATGGPAGMYADSVYPNGHYGSTGLALEAGAYGQNLTEWQYGLASVKPRWNVSGTYMQVLPRFVSTDKDGGDEREFLFDFFTDKGDALSKVFFKGYQWPFDVRKVKDGSSIIDILVYLEALKGRRVFLDFRSNPLGEAVDFNTLVPEARDYLEKAGACFGTPIQRLLHMNTPAVEFYRDRNVDLETEMLEIALCAQHNNGGLAVDCWWHSNLEGFFACGEAAGTHGVYRPGGSALNSGQVGAIRCAQYIAAKRQGEPCGLQCWEREVHRQIAEMVGLVETCNSDGRTGDVRNAYRQAAVRMSRFGAAIRNTAEISSIAQASRQELAGLAELAKDVAPAELPWLYRLRDMLISQIVYLGAMEDYITQGGASRGSALYSDPSGEKPYAQLPDTFAFRLDDGGRSHLVQQAAWNGGNCIYTWRKVRPIPQDDDFFENVWRSYRENGNIY